MRRMITASHNRLAHKIKRAFGVDWKVAFGWARRSASDETELWAERPDSVFGFWCLHSLTEMHRHMDALANGYALTGERWRAKTFRNFASRLAERKAEGRGATLSEILNLGGVGSGVVEEALEFYQRATDPEGRTPTRRASALVRALNERARLDAMAGHEIAWVKIVRDELARPCHWRHLAVYGGGLQGGPF